MGPSCLGMLAVTFWLMWILDGCGFHEECSKPTSHFRSFHWALMYLGAVKFEGLKRVGGELTSSLQ